MAGGELSYPPLVRYSSIEEYRSHFERVYCRGPICTFDWIQVRFRKTQFDHCFFESSHRDGCKDSFSARRAERVDWIKTALEDPSSERYRGWDKQRKRYDGRRRVAVVMGNYVVVIAIMSERAANFVTAFVAETSAGKGRPSTIERIRRSPRWE